MLLACVIGAISLPSLKFNLEIEQFFPEDDEDLDYFLAFTENFEPDDNYLLIALYRDEGIWNQDYLKEVRDFSIACRRLPHVDMVQSLPLTRTVRMTPFGPIPKPLVDLRDERAFAQMSEKTKKDPLFNGYLFSKDQQSTCVILKTSPDLQYDNSHELMVAVKQLIDSVDIGPVHMLGRPYFQEEMVAFEKREILVSGAVSLLLVLIILAIIFRHWMPVMLALISIGLSALLLLSIIVWTGSELTALAAMFPVIMVIVGTSDIVHLYTKYFDEVKSGKTRKDAIQIMVSHIGVATLMTSVTTALGFITLATSKIASIRSFGIDAAIGVMLAYAVTLLFAYLFLPLLPRELCNRVGKVGDQIVKPIMYIYHQGRRYPRRVLIGSLIIVAIIGIGLSKVTSDYQILKSLPRGTNISTDFVFFEDHYGGFRPVEFAVELEPGKDIWSPEVLTELDRLETHVTGTEGMSRPISIVSYVEVAHRILKGHDELYLPADSADFAQSIALAQKIPQVFTESLISRDATKLRVSSNIRDIGAERIKDVSSDVDQWIEDNMDKSLMSVRRTGKSILIEKNADFIKQNIFQGLGIALAVVSVLMFLLFRNWKFLLISLVPNILPLLVAGALIGYLGIEMEAGISIVFAIIFGIAVDDTIHFLSKYKLELGYGKSQEEALLTTFRETGKAILITSIILFFGFLVLLFSNYPPSNTIGMLISVTLVSALISDVYIIPLMVRMLSKTETEGYGSSE